MPENQFDLFPAQKEPCINLPATGTTGGSTYFSPERIILAKGSLDTPERKNFADRICSQFPQVPVEKQLDTPHNRINLGTAKNAFERNRNGKKTLVIGEMKSAVRLSDESGNTCPNYRHFSVFGFCPYGCAYCYLAGTPGVWYSPSVKIYVNLPEIIGTIDKQARKIAEPVSFYHGKLQDGLAFEPLTGYMRTLIPFFAGHPYARQIILTKSDAVDSILPLDHGEHTILSWSLNPPEIASRFEPNTPPVESRLRAMKLCADAGYPMRAVIMPVIPAPDWQPLYGEFLERLLTDIPLARLTIGGICSYTHARNLLTRHVGSGNPISDNMALASSGGDGRRRYTPDIRIGMYRYLVDTAKRLRPDLQIALCLEETEIWEKVGDGLEQGVCNCVL